MEDHQFIKTFNEILFDNEQNYSDAVYLRQPINGIWHEFTWQETMQQARKMVSFLNSIGLKKGDTVSILGKNCAEWFITDFAIALGGFISIPLFPSQHQDAIKYILNHAEVKAIFVGKLDNWQAQEAGIPDNVIRIALPYENTMPAQYHWAEILSKYEPTQENHVPQMEDLYTVVYTSGTTGNPKGVMITFGAQANIKKFLEDEGIFKFQSYNTYFSYLPLGHVAERVMVEYTSICTKSNVSFPQSLDTFAQNLREVSPTVFFSVPRIWNQFQKNIFAVIPEDKFNLLMKIPVVRYFFKKRIRKVLGLSRSTLNICGSAPVSDDLLKWYENLGIHVLTGYGRTEDLTICTGDKDTHKPGTVGEIRPGIEVKIDENGEILTRSNMMMSGYYKNPEATKLAFTDDGFMHTGDIGSMDEEGFLIIQGRKNEPFKTDKGEFVNPVPIEHMFAKNNNIEQMCLIGSNMPQPVLLVVLSEAAHKIDPEALSKNLRDTLNSINQKLTKLEKVGHIIILKEMWTPENALLTPSLKVKRNAVEKKYEALARDSFKSEDIVIWER